MAIELEFLGWDAPALPAAAAWLMRRFGPDMSGVLVVTPAGRAGRRLLELLVQQSEDAPGSFQSEASGDIKKTSPHAGATSGGPFAPPRIITQGALPEQLYEAEAVASPFAFELALGRAIRDAPLATRAALTTMPPEPGDVLGELDLAGQLARVLMELGAEGVAPDRLPDHSPDRDRWSAIAALDAAARALLERQGLTDLHAARRAALEQDACRCDRAIVLLGTADLPDIARRMLARLDASITALIHAPRGESAAFEADGTLRTDAWADRPVPLTEDQLVIADQPADQARAVLDTIARATQQRELTPDQVTVGLGAEDLGPTVARTLELAGVDARLAGGTPISRSRPARLLQAAGRFIRTGRYDDLAALLRHPDLGPHLQAHRGGAAAWLTLLDRYAGDHLQGRVTGDWLGRDRDQMRAVYDAVLALLPADPDEPRPLPGWARDLAAMLSTVYGHAPLRRFDAEDRPVVQALTSIGETLGELADLDPDGPITPRVRAHEAIGVLLARLGERATHPEGDAPAVELLGLLELPLDDAELVVLTGLNEGAIPSSITADPLLPGSLRTELGLPDNRRRLARDLYFLLTLLHARPGTVLITGQRGSQGDPLPPSRLLLRDDPAAVARRLGRFYDDEVQQAPPPEAAPPLLRPGIRTGPSALVVPPPIPPARPITRLRVTAFRDYIACPYRFYLRHVLGLEASDDRADELDGRAFGTLAHDVLQAFGRSDLADSEDPGAIEKLLHRTLEHEVRERFGREPRAAILVQREQLRQRFTALARWQAQQAAAGWRIVPEHIEEKHRAVVNVDGEPFTITGRIDRIDRHPEHGYRVLDYKTADAAEPPKKTHRGKIDGEATWVDLQLPLYELMARATGVDGPITLGYVLLPRDLDRVGLAEAGWTTDELTEAQDEATQIIRQIRQGVFWPPRQPPRYDDEFTRLCYDHVADRAATLRGAADA